MMKYVATLTCHYSNRDIYGNCYWYFEYLDHHTGHRVKGYTGNCGEGNIHAAMPHLFKTSFLSECGVNCLVQNHPIREFNRIVKGLEYVGSDPMGIAAFIERKLVQGDTDGTV